MISKKFLIILLVVLIAMGVGIFYIFTKQTSPTQQATPTPSPISPTPTPFTTQSPNKQAPTSSPTDETTNWKTYRSEKYGFEFRYPTTWKVDEDTHSSFVQLQEVKNGKVIAIAGSITIIKKPTSSPIDSSYKEMFASDSRCPVAAGSRNLSSESQYEEYVYCLTGQNTQISAGTWKGAVECSASQWYGMKVDPNTCPHQFWIDTKDFFYVVHFGFFEPIKDNSDEATFFGKFLQGFSFF